MRIKKKKKTTLLLLLLLMVPKTNSLKEVSILKSNVLTFQKAVKSPGGCCSVAKSCPTLCDPMNCNVPGFPVFYYLPRWLKLVSIELVMPSNHLILCCPLLLPSTFPRIRAFPMSRLFTSGGQSTGASASASVFPVNISFRTDWFDLLVVQGTLKSLLWHHNSKAPEGGAQYKILFLY